MSTLSPNPRKALLTVTPLLSQLIVTFVILLIAFLAYPSQYLLLWPRWTPPQRTFFNLLVASIWISYYRAIHTPPGSPLPAWVPDGMDELTPDKHSDAITPAEALEIFRRAEPGKAERIARLEAEGSPATPRPPAGSATPMRS